MPLHERAPGHIQPDEWGMFDPDQAGLAAVLAKLDARPGPPPADPAPSRSPAPATASRAQADPA